MKKTEIKEQFLELAKNPRQNESELKKLGRKIGADIVPIKLGNRINIKKLPHWLKPVYKNYLTNPAQNFTTPQVPVVKKSDVPEDIFEWLKYQIGIFEKEDKKTEAKEELATAPVHDVVVAASSEDIKPAAIPVTTPTQINEQVLSISPNEKATLQLLVNVLQLVIDAA